MRSILAQSYPHWELLIMEDGSQDDTVKIAESFRDARIQIYADGKRQGIAARLNEAIASCKGTYLARMDGDDICYPKRLENQVAYLEAHTEIDLLGTGAMVFSGSGAALGSFPLRITHEQICARPWAGFYFPHPTWMGRIGWFRRYRYREGIPRAEDQDLLLRSYRESRFAALSEILLGYRLARLSLRRILLGRYGFSQALLQEFRASMDWRLITGLVEQPLKAVVDIFAICSGANLRLLRHRALPVDDQTRTVWNDIWMRFSAQFQNI
jgi:glycosyltransferase involved in cell wall biosynthesis